MALRIVQRTAATTVRRAKPPPAPAEVDEHWASAPELWSPSARAALGRWRAAVWEVETSNAAALMALLMACRDLGADGEADAAYAAWGRVVELWPALAERRLVDGLPNDPLALERVCASLTLELQVLPPRLRVIEFPRAEPTRAPRRRRGDRRR